MTPNRLITIILCLAVAVTSQAQLYSTKEKHHMHITHAPEYRFQSVNKINYHTTSHAESESNSEEQWIQRRATNVMFRTAASKISGGVWSEAPYEETPPRGPQRSPGVPKEEEEQLPLDFDWCVGIFMAILAILFGRKRLALSSAKQ